METVEKDLESFSLMLASSEDLQRTVESPLIKRPELQKAMTALADKAKFHKLTKNFLCLLAENRRLGMVASIIQAVKGDMARRRGEVNAKVETAFALSDAQTKALKDTLAKSLGSKVTLDVSINRDLIGGMIVTVGSRMIDDSVKRKLERLERAMKSNSNTNKSHQQKEVS